MPIRIPHSTRFLSPDFKKAIREAKRRQILEKSVFDNLAYQNRVTAFTVAGDLTNRSIGTILNSANTAIENGVGFRDFTKSLPPDVLKKITVPDVVFRNAMNNTYQKARFDQQQRIKEIRPVLEYNTAGDEQVRPNHAAMNKIVADQDDPFWSDNYPPNGHRCRCAARALSLRQVKARHLNVETKAQADKRIAQEQIKKGVPKSKLVKPQADKGWKGSFKNEISPYQGAIDKYSGFQKAAWRSIVTSPMPKPIAPPTPKEIKAAVGKPPELIKIPLSQKEVPHFTSREKAAKWAKTNMGVTCDFKGLNHNVWDDTNQGLWNTYRRHKKLPTFNVAARDIIDATTHKVSKEIFAEAGYGNMHINKAWVNKFKTKEALDKALKEYGKNYSWYNRATKVNEITLRRWLVGDNFVAVVEHETGHNWVYNQIHQWKESTPSFRFARMTNQMKRFEWNRSLMEKVDWVEMPELVGSKKWQVLSRYGNKNAGEALAEAYSAMMRGEKLPAKLIAPVKDYYPAYVWQEYAKRVYGKMEKFR